MKEHKTTDTNKQPTPPVQYQRPQLTRWGTLRELTAGGGGTKNEPSTKMKTRF
jgi:hypothetical protein